MRAYTNDLRQRAIALHKKGEKRVRISEQLCVHYKTISRWINRYELEGERGLIPRYKNCGGHQIVSEQIKQEGIELKKDHSLWGGAYIKMKLQRKYPSSYIPSERQLQRYFHCSGLIEKGSKLPNEDKQKGWSKSAFYRVQVDAKEQIQTKDEEWCSYLTFTDEYTGAVLEALVFPL